MIHQGDKYGISIDIKSDDVSLTSSDVDGVKVKIGKYQKYYPDGGLTYSDENKWIFNLTQEQTTNLIGKNYIQVQIKKDDEIIGSDISEIEIKKSIIKDLWDEE